MTDSNYNPNYDVKIVIIYLYWAFIYYLITSSTYDSKCIDSYDNLIIDRQTTGFFSISIT